MVSLKDIEVQWYEGSRLKDYGDSPAFDSWGGFQEFLVLVYDAREKDSGGYTKVKVKIIWEDGQELVDRVDVLNGS